MNNGNLNKNIKILREKHNLKQEVLAMMIEKKYKQPAKSSTVSKWENMGATPSIYQLRALSGIFGVSMESLIEEDFSVTTSQSNNILTNMFNAVLEDAEGESVCYPMLCKDDEFILDPNSNASDDIVRSFHAIRYMEESSLISEDQLFEHKFNLFQQCNLLKGLCCELIVNKLKKSAETIEDQEAVKYLLQHLPVTEDEEPAYSIDFHDMTVMSTEYYWSGETPENYSYYNGEYGFYACATMLGEYYECLSRVLGYFDRSEVSKRKAVEDMVVIACNGNNYAEDYLIYWLDLKTKTIPEVQQMLQNSETWVTQFLNHRLDVRAKELGEYENDITINQEQAKDFVLNGPLIIQHDISDYPGIDLLTPYLRNHYPAYFTFEEFVSLHPLDLYEKEIVEQFKSNYGNKKLSYTDALSELTECRIDEMMRH